MKSIIAGNWKMNKSVSQSRELLEELSKIEVPENVESIVCPPFTSLMLASEILEDSDIMIGAQNMYYESSGAYTGEISPEMLTDINVEYVILGHSERREIFGEKDELINTKVLKALTSGLKPIVCCGETAEERETKAHFEKIEGQIRAALEDVEDSQMTDVVIAYEPIWAIGTGKTASSEDAEEMCLFIRDLLSELYSEDIANSTRILYGGSVNPGNISELMDKPNVNGALVGGASLNGKDFGKLINYE